MNRRTFFRNLMIGTTGICSLHQSIMAQGSMSKNKPNMLIYLSDDHSLRDCSVYGAADIPTPHMEKLAKAGLKFNQAFIASPACAPSRAALLTGLMPARNGAERNHSWPLEEINKLPSYMKELGYEVAAFGKVAHGAKNDRFGFDNKSSNASVPNLKLAVTEYLEQRKSDKPLCLFVGTSNPHVGWPEETSFKPEDMKLPPTFVDTPDTRKYRTMYYEEIKELDVLLGELRALANKHLGSNTLFVYTSDHGAQWPFGKWNLYDDGMRTPFIAEWPGKIKPKTETNAMISWIDILPTLVDMGGGTPPKDIDGRSFLDVLTGKKDKHRDVIFATHSGNGNKNVYPIRAIRTPKWKFIINLHPEFAYTTHIDLKMSPSSCAYWISWVEKAKTDPNAKKIVDKYYKRPEFELYNINDDPIEQNNLAKNPEYSTTLNNLKKQLKDWMKEQGDQETVFGEPYAVDQPETYKPGNLKNRAQPKKKKKSKGQSFSTGGKVILSSSEQQGQIWAYTFDKPSDDWANPVFNDKNWKRGPGQFGNKRTSSSVRTIWNTPDIWLRREFSLTTVPNAVKILVNHDEDAEIYINNTLFASFKGHKFEQVTLKKEKVSCFKKGKNVIAVHCHQTKGGQVIDVAIEEI